MSDKEFKKFDTKSVTLYFNVRLAKDATVKEFDGNTFVTLTFVDSSRLDSDEEMWIDANVLKSQAVAASYMEKGDVLSFDGGKMTMRRWGDDNEKVSFNYRNASPVISPELINTLKERGWTPGSDTFKGAEAAKPAGKKRGRPPGKAKAAPTPAKGKSKIPVEIDLDDDDAESVADTDNE